MGVKSVTMNILIDILQYGATHKKIPALLISEVSRDVILVLMLLLNMLILRLELLWDALEMCDLYFTLETCPE